MAQTIGKAGGFTNEKSGAYSRKIRLALYGMGLFLGFILGGVLVSAVTVKMSIAYIVVMVCVGLLMFAVNKVLDSRFDDWLQREKDYELGSFGERRVASILKRLPDNYFVINGLKTSTGDIDHVVVGPTGIFAIDTKHWRGVVKSDGKGELLLNDKPTSKPFVGRFVARMMETREIVFTHIKGQDFYFQAIFAFSRAWLVNLKGATRAVDCLKDDELLAYIEDRPRPEKLKPADVERIADVFRGLTRMDRDFAKPESDDDENVTQGG
jgi:hypothetical protein